MSRSTTGKVTPPGEAGYFGVQTGLSFCLYEVVEVFAVPEDKTTGTMPARFQIWRTGLISAPLPPVVKRWSCRGDCPNFEPMHGIVEPFVAAFLLPPPPYLVRASQIEYQSRW